MTYPAHMKDIYQRLRELGFDAEFVRTWILPDWWDDTLASTPTNRALAEASISRMLGFRIADLRDPTTRLRLPATDHVRLKRRRDTSDKDVAATILLAERASSVIANTLVGLPAFAGPESADSARSAMLQKRRVVDLEALLDFAWSHGVAVFHIDALPSASKRISGMAVFCHGVPVVVLASRSDSPPWVAFHLAHELGHVLLDHVGPGRDGLADIDLDREGRDDQERAANAFACELLTGYPNPRAGAIFGLTGGRLAKLARERGSSMGVDPGALALIYGWNADRMPAAQIAIKLMGMDKGARAAVTAYLARHLPESPSDVAARFLALATAA